MIIIPRLILLTFVALSIMACEQLKNKVDHTAVTLDTNAHYSVYQKAPGQNWQAMTSNNTQLLKTVTFTVEDEQTAYGVVFVCPSDRSDRPHEVHIYYSTKAEMALLNFVCRISLDEIIERPVFGSITGVNMADSTNPEGEIVRLALSKDQSLEVWEAYALIVRAGARDVVALKGKQGPDGAIAPEKFLIRRGYPLGKSTVAREINVDFTGVIRDYYSTAFEESARSTVNIGGVSDGDVLDTSIGFLSRNQTLLNLGKSVNANFTFLPVPLQEFTQAKDEFFNAFEFNPGEGHELLVSAKTNNGEVSREVLKLFTLSNGVTHNLQLPQPVSNNPLLALVNEGDLEKIVINWNIYNDATSGQTRVYRWVLEGLAAENLPDKVPLNDVGEVKWNITVTPGWLDAIGAKGNNYTLVIPTHFEGSPTSVVINKDDKWRKEWGFRHSTPVTWEMSAISVADNNKAEDVIDYLLNRTFDDNLQFSQVYIRSVTQPSL